MYDLRGQVGTPLSHMNNTHQALYPSISTTTVFRYRVSFKRPKNWQVVAHFVKHCVCSLLPWAAVSESWDTGQDGGRSPPRKRGWREWICSFMRVLLLWKTLPRYPRSSLWPLRCIIILCQVKVQTSWGAKWTVWPPGRIIVSFFPPGLLGKTLVIGASTLYLCKVKTLRETGGGVTPLSLLPPSLCV